MKVIRAQFRAVHSTTIGDFFESNDSEAQFCFGTRLIPAENRGSRGALGIG